MRQTTGKRKSPGEKIVKDIKWATRKHYSSEEKIRIVLDGLRGEDSIAELCRREGISQGIYYKWSKDFMEAGKRRLAGDTARAANTDEVRGGKQTFASSVSHPSRGVGSRHLGSPKLRLALRCRMYALEPILPIFYFSANDCPADKPVAPKAQGLPRWSDALVTARDKSSVMTTSVNRLANIRSVFARPLARSIR